MKRFLILTTVILLVLAATGTAANSPIDKGSVILGGSVSFSSMGGDLYKVGNSSTTLVQLTPSIGYFVSPGLELGAEIAYTSISVGGVSASSFTFGPEVGYYFKSGARTEVKGSIYPYLKGFMLFYSSEGDKMTTFGGKGGMNFMLSNAVALDAGVKFQSDSYKPDGATTSTSGTILWVGAGITAFIF
ncbi:MAG: hypothetical protein HY851_09040 [candidate division Zixibacteria bacterium]|nr:hypothetical protein [candidate division Zixibacteria bacterium]